MGSLSRKTAIELTEKLAESGIISAQKSLADGRYLVIFKHLMTGENFKARAENMCDALLDIRTQLELTQP